MTAQEKVKKALLNLSNFKDIDQRELKRLATNQKFVEGYARDYGDLPVEQIERQLAELIMEDR